MAEWPVRLRGVTESLVATEGPNGLYNVAALGLHREDHRVRARTWGRTRTWRNFRERPGGYVQFTHDPVDFVESALGVWEESDPIVESADAWVRVAVQRLEGGQSGGTNWVDWELRPRESTVERECVPTINRGFNAVVEATVAASRLDVESYDTERLRERLDYCEGVVRRCGGSRERRAFGRLASLVDHEGLEFESF